MAPNQIAEELKLRAEKVYTNAIARITFTDGSMPELKAFLWDEKKEIRELSVSGQDVSLPQETGRQIIEVRGKWPNGEASYTFVVQVE